MIDNFQTLADFIQTNDKYLTQDNFYFCQIISRAKDGGINSTIRDFYIRNSEHLSSKKEQIISFCEMFNARAYFNPTPKSYKKCTLNMLKRIPTFFENESYDAAKGLFSSSAGLVETRDTRFNKVWIVDYDTGDSLAATDIIKYLEDNKIDWSGLQTKNGLHFLTKPFDLRNCPFDNKVQKHNPTLLYFKGE